MQNSCRRLNQANTGIAVLRTNYFIVRECLSKKTEQQKNVRLHKSWVFRYSAVDLDNILAEDSDPESGWSKHRLGSEQELANDRDEH